MKSCFDEIDDKNNIRGRYIRMFATPQPVMLILTANYSYILLLSDLIFFKTKGLRYRNIYIYRLIIPK